MANAQGRATIVEVAAAAGVSVATAGRALGGYGAVSNSSRDRVLRAAEQLSYRRNDLARAVIRGRSDTIGLIVGDIANPFFSSVVKGVTDVARAGGFEVLLANTDEDPLREQAAMRVLSEKRVDGLIVAPSSYDPGPLRRAHESGCPIVLIDRQVEGAGLDCVLVDDFAASVGVVRRFLALGHTRIGMLTTGRGTAEGDTDTRETATSRERVKGFLQALADSGETDPGRYLRIAEVPELVTQAAIHLLSQDEAPTAVYASDSRVALSLVAAVRELELEVPGDLSIVTFDDAEWTRVLRPALAVVAQPAQALGAKAAERLLARIAGRHEPPQIQFLPTELIERGSLTPRS